MKSNLIKNESATAVINVVVEDESWKEAQKKGFEKAKSKLKLSYEPSWDLESKIITPITQILCYVHAQVLCRLQFLEKSIKLNPFDRDKVSELRQAHEKAFLKVDLNFKRFLKFYRQKTTYILSFKLKSA